MPPDSHFQLAVTPSNETSKTNITTCFMISKNQEIMEKHFPSVLTDVSVSSPQLFSNPFYLPTLMTELNVRASTGRLLGIDLKLGDLEGELGQHSYQNLKQGDPLKVDFGKKTSELNFLARNVEVIQLRLESMKLILELLGEWIRPCKKDNNGRNTEDILEAMEEFIADLKNTRAVTSLRVEFCRRRKDALIQVVS